MAIMTTPLTDSPRITRSESRHSSKQAQSEPTSDSEAEAGSDSSSSDLHSEQPQYYTLHRHLDFQLHSDDQRLTGIDLFAAHSWSFNPQQLKQFIQLNDTDLVQIHRPVPTKAQPSRKNLTLADILPNTDPSPGSSSHPHSTPDFLPRIPSDPFSGPAASSLYYSAYSSFAPCHDSSGSSQSIDLTRLNYLSQKKIRDWCQRSNRYFDNLDRLTPLELSPSENVSNRTHAQQQPAAQTRGGAGPGRRKRQKTSSSSATTPSTSPAKDPQTVETPEYIRQLIQTTLTETSKLIHNLQERQFDRLRLSQREQEDEHLDPLLSAPFSTSRQNKEHPFPARTIGLEPSREELEEANQLIRRLASLMARRPRPTFTDQTERVESPALMEQDERSAQPGLAGQTVQVDGDQDATLTLIPSLESIQKSYQTLLAQSVTQSGWKNENSNTYYYGQLPANNAVGVLESTLVSPPDQELISSLEQTLTTMAPPAHVARTGARTSGSVVNTPFRWDPNVSTPRTGSGINLNGDLISSNHRQATSGNVAAKLHAHLYSQQHQDQIKGSVENHLHAPHSLGASNLTQIEQQKYLQHLQVQKLLNSIPNSNLSNANTNKPHHYQPTRFIPPVSSPSPIPHITPPTLHPSTISSTHTNTSRLINNGNTKSMNPGSLNGLSSGAVGLSHFVGFGQADSSLTRDNHHNLDTHPNYKALASNSASFTR